MGQKVTFHWDTKIIQVDITPTNGLVEIDVKTDIYSDGKEDWKNDAILNKFNFPVTPVGGDALPGSKALGSTFFLEYGWVIRPYNTSHTLSVNGNMYARDGSDPYIDTIGAFTVRIIQSVSNLVDSTVQQLAEIERSTFQDAVWVDVLSPNSGTTYPNGNVEYPVNNVVDALAVLNERGFREVRVIGNLVTDNVLHDLRGLHLVGVSHINSVLEVGLNTLCESTRFTGFDMTGVLDGDSEIRDCIVRDLTYFNGHIHDSYLVGRITLAGSLNANIEQCKILDFSSPPTIDCGGSGQDLMMPNYSGVLYVDNLNGNSLIGIGMDAGQVVINNTCTAGLIQISGTGSVVDNSGVNCYVVDSIINGTDVQNLSRLIELQRPHHTGTGNIWFWNPYGGNDAWDGKHADRATKTFAQAHTLAEDNNHDIIICVSGDPSGNTVANENIVISKNYLFLRGPGRDFRIHSLDDNLPTIDILSNGVEVSGMVVTNNQISNDYCISASGSFPYITNIYIEESASGIHITNGAFGIINNVRLGHGIGTGITIDGGSEHFTLQDCHIGSHTGDGVNIDITSGHEVTFKGSNLFHGNSGWGINISANTSGVQINTDTIVYDNALGAVNDLGSNTNNQYSATISDQTESIWDDINDQDPNTKGAKLKDIHLAETGRRQSVGLVDTIYEDDLVTPRKTFDITKDGNGEVIEINPQ